MVEGVNVANTGHNGPHRLLVLDATHIVRAADWLLRHRAEACN